MKRLKFVFWAALVVLPVAMSCVTDSDSEISLLREEMERLKLLEKRVNDNVAAVNGLVTAMNGSKMIRTVEEISSPEPGYRIVFTDGEEMVIFHATEADVPQIGVVRDGDDGSFYWVVNGVPLTVDGAKVPVTGPKGDDGLAPRLRVNPETGMWEVSYDGGEEWVSLDFSASGPQGPKGDSFLSVTEEETFYVFTLSLPDSSTTSFRLRKFAEIRDVDITDVLPVPVEGAQPARSFFAGEFGGMVKWWLADGITPFHGPFFRRGVVYLAEITLMPVQGYFLFGGGGGEEGEEDEEDFIEVRFGESLLRFEAAGAGNACGRVTFGPAGAGTGFEEKVIGMPLDITALLPAPIVNGSPTTGFTDGHLTAAVVWYESLGEGQETLMRLPGFFLSGATYRAVVTLRALTGYRFPDPSGEGGDAVSVRHSGSIDGERVIVCERDVDGVYDEVLVRGSVRFGEIGKVIPADLTDLISAPFVGETGAGDFSTDHYTADVTWRDGGRPMAADEVFQSGKPYEAVVSMIARPDCSFGAVMNAYYFRHDGAASVENSVPTWDRITVTLRFAAAQPGRALDANPDLAAFADFRPVRGAVPVTNISSLPAGYGAVTVSWSPADSPFRAGVVYTARVTLTPASQHHFPAGYAPFCTDATVSAVGSANAARFWEGDIIFPKTESLPITTPIDLSNSFPSPVPGGYPTSTFDRLRYTISVSWSPADNPFRAGVTYTATVMLTAKTSEYGFLDEETIVTHSAGITVVPFTGTEEVITGQIRFDPD
jgi:hypothetical protein